MQRNLADIIQGRQPFTPEEWPSIRRDLDALGIPSLVPLPPPPALQWLRLPGCAPSPPRRVFRGLRPCRTGQHKSCTKKYEPIPEPGPSGHWRAQGL